MALLGAIFFMPISYDDVLTLPSPKSHIYQKLIPWHELANVRSFYA
uniref:Uncharacterized protein n=1 Tax=Rhizophora mucronata TaxID=61149 RepID=A0A2P2PRB8_RHIMU